MKKIIKSCKATNLEFLKLKEKLGLCTYGDICDEQELTSMSEENFTQHDVENNQSKEENEKLIKENEKLRQKNEKFRKENENEKREMTNENEQFKEKTKVKDGNIKELIEEPKEIKSLNWLDKNKFEKILAITDSSKFN